MMQEIEIRENIKWVMICMKIILRYNLVHSLMDRQKKTNPITFNITCLKAYHSSFMSLILFYFIIFITATTQFLSNQTSWVILYVLKPGRLFPWLFPSLLRLADASILRRWWNIASESLIRDFCISSFENQASLSSDHYKWLSTELFRGWV